MSWGHETSHGPWQHLGLQEACFQSSYADIASLHCPHIAAFQEVAVLLLKHSQANRAPHECSIPLSRRLCRSTKAAYLYFPMIMLIHGRVRMQCLQAQMYCVSPSLAAAQ